MAANAVPIIVRRKKAAHAAHHGGAWKVAYADFVTAMMAFFLLLWLLNSTTQEQRSGISEYFNAASVARNTSGAGQVLGGATITLDGPSKGRGAPIGVPLPPPENTTNNSDADSEDKVDTGTKDERVKEQDNAGKNKDAPPEDASEAQMNEILRQREDRMFEQAEKVLKQAVETTPGLRKLADNLLVERTPEGLRIQIVDQGKTSMFASGSSVPYQHTRQLLEVVAQVIARMPNKVSISGHTDAVPYARGASYGNWELSSDRAHASRRELIRFGVDAERMSKVVGRAETEPLVSGDPKSARNRRIAITLLRQAPPPPKVGNTPKADVTPSRAALPDALKPPAPPSVPNIVPPPPAATGAGGLHLAPKRP